MVFVLVAAISAGLVAVVTFVLAREYRLRATRSTSLDEARFALAVAPDEFDEVTFERFRTLYEQRSDADILVVQGSTEFTSGANLSVADVPSVARRADERSVVGSRCAVDGRPVLVAGASGRDGADFYVFFSLEQLEQGLDELAQAAALSWLVTIVAAAAVGWFIARRALKPVAQTAAAAEAIAGGDLAARLPRVTPTSSDSWRRPSTTWPMRSRA